MFNAIQNTAITSTNNPVVYAECHYSLGAALAHCGERFADFEVTKTAVDVYRRALNAIKQRQNDRLALELMNALGSALTTLDEISDDEDVIEEAIELLLECLNNSDPSLPLSDRVTYLNNLGVARRRFGDTRKDLDTLHQARDDFDAAANLITVKSDPFFWAILKWNIADLNLAQFTLSVDPDLLVQAEKHALAARDVFAQGSDHQTERCDELLAKIRSAAG